MDRNSPRKTLAQWKEERNRSPPPSPQQLPPQNSTAPLPHSVDLLRNRQFAKVLGPFDGNVAAFAHLGAQHYFITTNTDYVPAIPSLHIPHAVFLRSDMRYGTDDPTLWPQQWTSRYCHLPLIPKKGSRPELDIMWWNPTPTDFAVGSAVTRGLGRLKRTEFSKLIAPVNALVDRCSSLRQTSPHSVIPLFDELIQHILICLEQLQTLPTTFPKMVFGVTSLQRAFLELAALYDYMTVYKPRLHNYQAPLPNVHAVAKCVGAFTSTPTVAQQLWAAQIPFWFLRPVEVFDAENILKVVPLLDPSFGLPDDNAHGVAAPPVLYSGNSTLNKIEAIHRAAVHTPWYHDPFETGFTRARSPSPTPAPVQSTSTPSIPVAGGSRPAPRSRDQTRFKPYTQVKVEKKGPATQKVAAKVDRDKFARVVAPEMPPSIISMVNALGQVDRGVVPYTSDEADKRYVLPEPALFVTTTPARQRKFLHHWNLLSDGFFYMLAHEPQLLGPQDWRDILEGLITKRGAAGSRAYRRSERLEQTLRPVLEACDLKCFEGFPILPESVPEFSLEQARETIWQVAEISFRFEFCSLDRRASGKQRLAQVKECFAGHMLLGVPLEMSKHGWASPTLEERHQYVVRTAKLMLDWTTKSTRPNIIRGVAERSQWSSADMQALETAVCQHYTQAFWEHFGRAAVLPMRLDHDLEKEEGEL